MIRCETERYAAQKNQPINISAQEIKTFLAIVTLTGYTVTTVRINVYIGLKIMM